LSRLNFEWDPAKAAANVRKHRISFEEATTVFEDPKILREYDAEHSTDEDREIAIGFSSKSRLLMVVSTERSEAIGIISARKANANETRRYAAGN